jgi:hypothetical protein
MEQDRLSPGQKGKEKPRRKEKERKIEVKRKDKAEGTEGYISEQYQLYILRYEGVCAVLFIVVQCTLYIL